MATYYVGTSSAGLADGTSWANRYGTLNAAEDRPLVSGDVVYVGPGVYREMLTVDVDGASAITYIGDVTGEHTDGIGGPVRLTGLAADTNVAGTRASCISSISSAKDYRTFRGFHFDGCSSYHINPNAGTTNWIIEDCVFTGGPAGGAAIYLNNCTATTVRRCMFLFYNHFGIELNHSSVLDNANILLENCLFICCSRAISNARVGGVTVKNCTFTGCGQAIRVITALSVGQTVTMNNNLFMGLTGTVLQAATAPATNEEITENYNNFYKCSANRSNVTPGANSYPTGGDSEGRHPLPELPLLLDGHMLPWRFGALGKWSSLARIAGTGMSADDLYGLARPATDSKKSWGAIQYTGAARSTVQAQAGSVSLTLPDAGEQFLMRVPVAAESTVFSLYVYREANYAGTAPQMILRQPGQADQETTDGAAAGQWNQLSDTHTPAASPPWLDIFVRSSNTATSGSYAVYVDTVAVA